MVRAHQRFPVLGDQLHSELDDGAPLLGRGLVVGRGLHSTIGRQLVAVSDSCGSSPATQAESSCA